MTDSDMNIVEFLQFRCWSSQFVAFVDKNVPTKCLIIATDTDLYNFTCLFLFCFICII